MRHSTLSSRTALRARLEGRRHEIEQEVFARVYAVTSLTGREEPGYVDGISAAVAAALDYALEAIEHGEERAGPPPPIVLAQARLAARSAVSLDTVLRRYFAGYTLLGDFIVREASAGDLLRSTDLKTVSRGQAALFDQLIAAIAEEYRAEVRDQTLLSVEQRTAERVDGLLAGDLVDVSQLNYEIDDVHIGLVVVGPDAATAVQELAAALDQRCLVVNRGAGTTWAWLGGRRPLRREALRETLASAWPKRLSAAVGEQLRGLAGWRLSHRQAARAWPVASRIGSNLVHYSDVALVASALHDGVLAASLHQLYVVPLIDDGDDRGELCRTLRAYFAKGRNITAAAATLEVTRQTVRSRLRAAETRLARSLDECSPDLEVALQVDGICGSPEESRNPRLQSALAVPR